MSYKVDYKKHEGKGGHEDGPIHTPMAEEMIPGNSDEFKATGGGIYEGIDGYPKGTKTISGELAFDDSGVFGKVPKASPDVKKD